MDERTDEFRNVVRTLPRLAPPTAVKGAAAAADATEVLWLCRYLPDIKRGHLLEATSDRPSSFLHPATAAKRVITRAAAAAVAEVSSSLVLKVAMIEGSGAGWQRRRLVLRHEMPYAASFCSCTLGSRYTRVLVKLLASILSKVTLKC